MKVSEIIEEIAQLPPAEQQAVIRFAHKLEKQSQLSPPQLGALAKRLAGCSNDKEAATLKQKIVNGFYGGKQRA
jgi:hypothetical protein